MHWEHVGKHMIKDILPFSVKRDIKHLCKYIINREYRIEYINKKDLRQCRKSFGELNDNKVFYVIRRGGHEGFGSTYKNTLAELLYADRKGYIPVVDCKNYYNYQLQPECDKGIVNAWEYYFNPVSEFAIDEVMQSKNVVLSNSIDSKHWIYKKTGLRIYSDYKYRGKLTSIYKKYISFSIEADERLKSAYKLVEQRIQGKKILGVSVMLREQDLRNDNKLESIFNGRANQPSFDQVVKDIRNCMEEWGCDYFFISDDSDKYCKLLEEEFGDKVIFSSRRRVGGDVETADGFLQQIAADPKEYTLGYFSDIYILSRCNCFLAGVSSTSQIACIMNESMYEHERYYAEGLWK